jgi:hypothetical protein
MHKIIYKEKNDKYLVDIWSNLSDVVDVDIRQRVENNGHEYDFVCDYYRYILYLKEHLQYSYKNDVKFVYSPRTPSKTKLTEMFEDVITFVQVIKNMNKVFKTKSSDIQYIKYKIEKELNFYYGSYVMELKSINKKTFKDLVDLESVNNAL